MAALQIIPKLSSLRTILTTGITDIICSHVDDKGQRCTSTVYGIISPYCLQHIKRGAGYNPKDPRNYIKNLHEFWNYCKETGQTPEDVMRLMPQRTHLLELFEDFDILKGDVVFSMIECIGRESESENGFIRSLQYIKVARDSDGVQKQSEYFTINSLLKSSKNRDSDNLFWEYCAGRVVNIMNSVIPIFSVTNKCYNYKTTSSYNTFRDICIGSTTQRRVGVMQQPFKISDYISVVPLRDSSLLKACILPETLAITVQNITHVGDLVSFIDGYYYIAGDYGFVLNPANMCYLVSLYQMLYLGLSFFGDNFTHYDLHAHNILVWAVPDDNWIVVHYLINDHEDYSYKIKYLPTIIDLGKSYFDLSQSTSNFNSATSIVQATQKTRVLKLACMNTLAPSMPEYHIDATKRNVSSDLKTLSYLKVFLPTQAEMDTNPKINDADFMKLFFDLIRGTNCDDNFGAVESTQTSLANGLTHTPVNNIYQAARVLYQIVKSESFQRHMDKEIERITNLAIKDNHTHGNTDNVPHKYGDLYITLDANNPFDFQPAQNPSSFPENLHPFKPQKK